MRNLLQISPDLNAYKFTFKSQLLDEIRQLYTTTLSHGLSSPQNSFLHEAIAPLSLDINAGDHHFHLKSYGKTPLLWISCGDRKTYEIFKRFADSLQIQDDIKELVDFQTRLIMYCGFFVAGNRLLKENWHVDYKDGANAYTFITPLFELEKSHGNLLYKDAQGKINKYYYKLGEGVIFGDHFLHSTERYDQSDKMRVLFSFTIGTDKTKYWPILKETVGSQSEFMYLPCGHEIGSCDCCD